MNMDLITLRTNTIMETLKTDNGVVMCSSLDVAERFTTANGTDHAKRHANVMRAIRNLEIPAEIFNANFEFVEIIEKNAIGGSVNKSYYLMTRDGFTWLVMGFTGAEAMGWKICYTNAFNAMEKKLMEIASGPKVPTNYLDALKALVESEEAKQIAEQKVIEQQEIIEEQAPKVEAYDDYMEADGGLNLTSAMKTLDLPPNLALAFLRKHGMLYSNQNNSNMPVRKAIEAGYFFLVTGTTVYDNVFSQTMVSPRGVEMLRRFFIKYEQEFNYFCALSPERRKHFVLKRKLGV